MLCYEMSSSTDSSYPTVSDLIDKLKALIKNKKKGTPATNGTTTTKTEAPTAAAIPEPTKTETAAAPSSSEPTAPPAGKLPELLRLEERNTLIRLSTGAAPVEDVKTDTPAEPTPATVTT